MLKDPEEKKRRGYTEAKSKVYMDGREVLVGKDWKRRKLEVWNRCEGRCEQEVCPSGPSDAPMERCRSEAHDPHHLMKRSKKRDDRLDNLQALCRMHHDLLDPRKIRKVKLDA